jgi:hypothetical protein
MHRKPDQLTPDEGRAQVGKTCQRRLLVPPDRPHEEPPSSEVHDRPPRPQVNLDSDRRLQLGTAHRDSPSFRIDPYDHA